MMKDESFYKLEDVLGEMEGIKEIMGLLLSEFLEFRVNTLNQEQLKEKYTIIQIVSNAIFDLLCFQTKELKDFIEKYIQE